MAKAPSTKNTPAINDPIEGSKMEEVGKPPAVEPAPPEAPPVVEAAAPAEPLPEPKRAVKYRVKSKTTVSLHGQIIVLNADDVVSAESYGPVGIERFLAAGVPLEELS